MISDTEMKDLTPEEQANKAIKHVLRQIRNNPDVSYHLGFGTQSFNLLTEAAATLNGEPVEKVRNYFMGNN